ncbi:MAG: sugar ABC transporter substrate-binding protein [Chloroflexi bacterium]|nr:sugar ABC transporter substrate-binding protein [Chloroflexota bacterium]
MSWDAPSDESERFLKTFGQQHAGLTVEYLHTPFGQYMDKFQTMLAGGTPPNVFLYSLLDWLDLQVKGQLLELTPLMKRDKFDTSDFFPKILAIGQWRDKQYGIGDNFVYAAIFYNKTVFQKAGLTLPSSDWKDTRWGWQAFVDDASRIAKLDVDGRPVFGFNMGTSVTNMAPWIWNHGGDLFNKDLSASTLDQPEAIDALQFIADWRYRHRFAPTPDQLRQEGQAVLYQQGRLGMWWDGPWSMQGLRQVGGLDWDVVPLPRGKANRLIYASGALWFIPKANPNAEESWALLQHMISKEGQFSMMKRFGFPGSRKSVALSQEFLSTRPPEHIRVFVDGAESVRPMPLFINWPDINRALTEELAPLWNGQKAAREVALAAKRAVDPLIKKTP